MQSSSVSILDLCVAMGSCSSRSRDNLCSVNGSKEGRLHSKRPELLASLRQWENHAGEELCSGRCVCLLHHPLQMLFHRVLTQVEAVRDLFVRESQHEIDGHHLLAISQMKSVLDLGPWGSHRLLERFKHNEQTALHHDRLMGEAPPPDQESVFCYLQDLLYVNRPTLSAVLACLYAGDQFSQNHADFLGEQARARFSGGGGL